MWRRRARATDGGRDRLVASLRRVAARGASQATADRRVQVMLLGRAAAVRGDLLAIAALLEQIPEPDTATCDALRRLLTDGCRSPLYNPRVHPSELAAIVYYAKRRLTADMIEQAGSSTATPTGVDAVQVQVQVQASTPHRPDR